jgi:hypothetical protein
MATSTPKKKKNIFVRILKWTGYTILVLLILLFTLPFIFKDKLIKIGIDQANKSLNAKLTIGKVDLTLLSSFPDFKLAIDSVCISGVNEFEKDTLAFIQHTDLNLDIKSVISGDQYKVKQIMLNEPRIFAHVLKDGKANWDITKPSTDTTASTDTSATKFKLSLNSFEIKKGLIRYEDESMDFSTALQEFDFNLDGDFTQDNFIMNIVSETQRMNMSYGGVAYAKNLHNKMKIAMDMNMPAMKFAFKENEFKLNDLVLGLDGYVAMPKDDIEMDLKFNCAQTEFNCCHLFPQFIRRISQAFRQKENFRSMVLQKESTTTNRILRSVLTSK